MASCCTLPPSSCIKAIQADGSIKSQRNISSSYQIKPNWDKTVLGENYKKVFSKIHLYILYERVSCYSLLDQWSNKWWKHSRQLSALMLVRFQNGGGYKGNRLLFSFANAWQFISNEHLWMFQSLRFWCPESSLEEWHWQTLILTLFFNRFKDLEVKKHFDVYSLIQRKELEEGCTTKIKEEHILKLFNILKSKASLPPQSHQIGHTSYKSPAAKITNLRYRWDNVPLGHVQGRTSC